MSAKRRRYVLRWLDCGASLYWGQAAFCDACLFRPRHWREYLLQVFG